MTDRISWDEVWMNMADTMAQRSKCCRATVGCVLVSESQNVLAASYNGPPANYKAEGSCELWCPRGRGEGIMDATYSNCPTVHAEVNAVARADHSKINGATAYSTRSTCINCAKSLAAAGITRLVHRVEDIDMHRNPTEVEQFLSDCGIVVQRWVDKEKE